MQSRANGGVVPLSEAPAGIHEGWKQMAAPRRRGSCSPEETRLQSQGTVLKQHLLPGIPGL